jgi:hypothetical protein
MQFGSGWEIWFDFEFGSPGSLDFGTILMVILSFSERYVYLPSSCLCINDVLNLVDLQKIIIIINYIYIYSGFNMKCCSTSKMGTSSYSNSRRVHTFFWMSWWWPPTPKRTIRSCFKLWVYFVGAEYCDMGFGMLFLLHSFHLKPCSVAEICGC